MAGRPPLVVDASILAAGLLADEEALAADALLSVLPERDAIAPSLLWHELRNILVMAERRGRVAKGTAEEALRDARLLGIEVAPERGNDEVVGVARAFGLTAYDAAYAALAIHAEGELATLDRRLIEAGQGGGFALWTVG